MRKSRQEAAETRRRIVDIAAAEFRENGIAGAAIADVMAKAGLTHGGFYKHFASKEDLVAEACAQALRDKARGIARAMDGKVGRGALKAVAEDYLSASHRDGVGDGCPLAALGGELARSGDVTRDVATEGLKRMVALVAATDNKNDPKAAEAKAIVIWSTMVGALILSRMTSDPGLSQKILKETQKHLIAT